VKLDVWFKTSRDILIGILPPLVILDTLD